MSDDDEYEEGIISDDEVILLKPLIPVSRKLCKCWNCSFYAHTNPPPHFSNLDEGYCCSWCRLSNGKNMKITVREERRKKEKN